MPQRMVVQRPWASHARRIIGGGSVPRAQAEEAAMELNEVAEGLEPLDMTGSEELKSLLQMALQHPELARALVFVDIAPVRSGEGGREIREFMRENIEFDRIEDFIERVRKYDPFRPVEHMERTARYNLFRRADGKYVAKSD